MAIEITTTWFASYIILSTVIVLGLLYSYIISVSELKGALGYMFWSALLINVGIIVHTAAIFKFGNDNTQVIEFTLSHILLLIGFIVLVMTGNKIRQVGKEVGFGE